MRATAVYAATVQQERANWMTPDCKGVLCIDVNGVLNEMSPSCIDVSTHVYVACIHSHTAACTYMIRLYRGDK